MNVNWCIEDLNIFKILFVVRPGWLIIFAIFTLKFQSSFILLYPSIFIFINFSFYSFFKKPPKTLLCRVVNFVISFKHFSSF
ncbi:hypothetical protein Mgra_00006850 [Meloidogyne graminicola]|uniref:Uncharacterized protein n=1 Tax=Meloidogyne graminicola TaxID=189291 RepID=A0A8S9ZK83_9BILA|nr:hypothetical protein Mgra_00006850 [Meloidogyne graminicola]